MLTEKVSQKISTLSSDLAVAISLDDPQAWQELSALCNDINFDLISEAEFILSDIAARAKDIFTHLYEATNANTDTAVSHLKNLISILSNAVDNQTYDQALAREVVANTDLYLSDLENLSKSTNAEPMIEIDEEFMQEIEGRIDRLETILFKVLQDGCDDAEECRGIFREFHTLKGEAGILGLTVLSGFWHSVEEVIQDARSGNLYFTRESIDSLLQMVKFGRDLLRNGKLDDTQKAESQETLAQLNSIINSITGGNLTLGSPPPSLEPIDFSDDSPKAIIVEDKDFSFEENIDKIEDEDEDLTFNHPDEDVEDDFFTMEPDNELIEEENEITYNEANPEADIPEVETSVETPMPKIPDPIIVEKPVVKEQTKPPEQPKPAQTGQEPASFSPEPVADKELPKPVEEKDVESYSLRNVQIEVKKLDALLDIVSEVSLIGSHLSSNLDLSKIPSVSGDLQELMRFCRTLNDMASSFRMTPIAPLFHRIHRAATDAARAMNKQVDLILEGQDTKVDRIVIERLSSALIHLVRNSVGHGIEPSGKRREANKSPVGKVMLSARQTGADIIIELSDDGSGLNTDKIKEKAINIGCIPADNNLKESEIIDLIFSSGFSTSDSVDGISGRGVGMSIVKESMDSLRGRIEVDNKPGEGVTFRLRFPVALAAVEALLVTLGENIIAIPVQSVRETFKLEPAQLSTIEGRGNMVNVRGVIVPLIKMSDFLGIEGRENFEGGVLILVDEGDKLATILVDTVMETRQVVIRQLEGQLRDIPEITGCALLSDRQIALVLDTRRVIENSYIASGTAYSDAGAVKVASERKVEVVTIGSNAVGIIDFIVRARKADGSIKNHKFAINAFKTREFVPATQLTPVPDMPKGFAGMLLLRDETIPVMSLDILLGLPYNGERSEEFENIIIICEFSGVTVGFIVTEVNSVSYISWNDIAPPPHGGPLVTLNHVIGTILISAIENVVHHQHNENSDPNEVAFLLDFEQIVQQVITLYDDIGDSLSEITLRKDITKILLVEDSPLIRKETARALEENNIQVLQASDGLEAQSILEQLYKQSRNDQKSIFNYLDLILSDIEMPQMDGYSLTQFVKNHPDLRLLPVLLHSSLTNDSIVARAKEVHADGFVPKCDPQKLVEHLRKYI